VIGSPAAAMTPKLRIAALAFGVSLTLDFVSKRLITHFLSYTDRHEIIPGFFYLTHVRNPGAAFGLFSDGDATIRIWFFVVVSLFAIGIILSFFRQLAPGDRLNAFALGLILGGAVGNLIDRIWLREVVDFLHVKLWGGYSWPDFNFADSFIVVGVAILILELLAAEGENRASAEPGEHTP
jgi:signal peptidase II